MEKMLNEDCRNNSAWSHRYFVVFGHEELEEMEKGHKIRKEILEEGVLTVDLDILTRELEFTRGWIEMAPQNPSPWNYLKGVLKRAGRPLATEREFCESFVRPPGGAGLEEGQELDFEGDAVRSSHAIDCLSEIYTAEGTEEGKERARRCLQALGSKWDIIRKNYWDYRAKNL